MKNPTLSFREINFVFSEYIYFYISKNIASYGFVAWL